MFKIFDESPTPRDVYLREGTSSSVFFHWTGCASSKTDPGSLGLSGGHSQILGPKKQGTIKIMMLN